MTSHWLYARHWSVTHQRHVWMAVLPKDVVFRDLLKGWPILVTTYDFGFSADELGPLN